VIGPLLIGSLLNGLAVAIGSVFCYIPGLVLGGLLMFTIPLIVDRRMDGIEAMKLSFNTLKGDALMATLFYLVVSIVGGLGGIACGIGALFTWPLFFLSISLLYRDYFMGPPTAYPDVTVPPPSEPMPPPGAAPPPPPA